MAIWERFSHSATLSAAGTHSNLELIYNGAETDSWESKDLVVLDGIVMLHANTDDLCGARLVVAHELLTTSDLSDTVPEPYDDMIYYSWFFSRGPSYFRLNSKKNIRMEHKLWITLWKENDANPTNIHAGLHLYVHEKSHP